jgi:hypothetical protein
VSRRETAMMYWSGIVGAPLVFLTALSAGYALVPWACRSQHHGVLDLVSVVALVLTLGATVWAALGWRRTHADVTSPFAAREEFLAQLAVASGVLSSIAVLAQWAARLAISPCVV